MIQGFNTPGYGVRSPGNNGAFSLISRVKHELCSKSMIIIIIIIIMHLFWSTCCYGRKYLSVV